MRKFKIGDRVLCVKAFEDNHHIVNQTGTIIGHWGDRTWTVEFDNSIWGHDGSGGGGRVIGRDKHCWNTNEDCLRFAGLKEVKIYGIVKFLEGIKA